MSRLFALKKVRATVNKTDHRPSGKPSNKLTSPGCFIQIEIKVQHIMFNTIYFTFFCLFKKIIGQKAFLTVALVGGLVVLSGCSGTSSSADKNKTSGLGKGQISSELLPDPESRILIVASPDDREGAALVSLFDTPMDRKLLDLFASIYNYTIKVQHYPSDQAALDALARGESHMAVGISSAASSGRTLRHGPEYAKSSAVLIQQKTQSVKNAQKNLASLFAGTVQSTPEKAVQDFVLAQAKNMNSTPALEIKSSVALTPLLEDLSKNQSHVVAANADMFNLLRSFFPQTKLVQNLNQPIAYQWHWTADNPELDRNLKQFWTLDSTRQEMEDYRERVFGFIPNKVPARQLDHLVKMLDQELPKYRQVILEEAARNNIDPLLIVAIIYQESKFKSSARHRSTYGLMQLHPKTAAIFVSGNCANPTLNIQAGSRYLRYLWDELEELQLPPWDRWALTLIAYNQGPGGLNKKISQAQQRDCAVASWPELKRILPYLGTSSRRPVDSDAVNYVDSVQYYYFFLRGLVILGRPESQHFGPGFETTPAGWLEI